MLRNLKIIIQPDCPLLVNDFENILRLMNGDARRLGIQNWWTVSMDRQGRRKILEKARSQPCDVEPRKKKKKKKKKKLY